jgi:hypothetical protein
MTRLPTERLATACWAFILTKRIGREPAPVLDFRPLRVPDKMFLSTAYLHPGNHLVEQTAGGHFGYAERVKAELHVVILDGGTRNRRLRQFEVRDH